MAGAGWRGQRPPWGSRQDHTCEGNQESQIPAARVPPGTLRTHRVHLLCFWKTPEGSEQQVLPAVPAAPSLSEHQTRELNPQQPVPAAPARHQRWDEGLYRLQLESKFFLCLGINHLSRFHIVILLMIIFSPLSAVKTITNFGNAINAKLLQLQFGWCFSLHHCQAGYPTARRTSVFSTEHLGHWNIQDCSWPFNITHNQEGQFFTPAAVPSRQTSIKNSSMNKNFQNDEAGPISSSQNSSSPLPLSCQPCLECGNISCSGQGDPWEETKLPGPWAQAATG